MSKHLWEVDHSYYCEQGNYFSTESVESYFKSFAEFMADRGNSDFDLNLVFRWDWNEDETEEGESTFNGDINYRNGKLLIFWMCQRKGIYCYSIIEVCRADEPAVIEFLKPRLEHLMALWAPLISCKEISNE